jgi:hypothetical protein
MYAAAKPAAPRVEIGELARRAAETSARGSATSFLS